MNILITGGAGFVGINLAEYLLSNNNNVTIFDNFSRSGSKENLFWIKNQSFNSKLKIIDGDIQNFHLLIESIKNIDIIYHLAGQVAVTSSLINPNNDIKNNLFGTFNILEAVRQSKKRPALIFTSTNKVYGSLKNLTFIENENRYSCNDMPKGISEDQPLDFFSPYGCSKGAADQYVHDYSRTYGLKTVVFRMSCIYGPRQFGTTHQGWLAHFIKSTINNQPITIYGDGKQVRDILFIDDLSRALDMAGNNLDIAAGNVYNIGGGPKNTISIWNEFSKILSDLNNSMLPPISYKEARTGDQCYYVSDIRKIKKELNWIPEYSIQDGISRLWDWCIEDKIV